MESEASALAALGHPARLAVFRLLARRAPGGARPGEIAAALGVRPNTLSAHLATLARAGLLRAERRGRTIVYRLERARIAGLLAYLADDCCRGRPELCLPIRFAARGDTMAKPAVYTVLFLCTGNSARSLIAEAIVNAEPSGRFRAWSAGTRPAAAPHPMALEVLRQHGHETGSLRSKHVASLDGPGAPAFDFVFTLCDSAANEECPVWPGHPMTAHWGIPDPAATTGTSAERALAFREAYGRLQRRLAAFMALPFEALDRLSLQQRLDAIGDMDLAEAPGA